MDICLAQLQEAAGGDLRLGNMPPRDGESLHIGRIVTDSREVDRGDVFLGITGPTHNGSDFAEEAFMRGAAGVIVSGRRVEPWAGGFSLEVPDTMLALWQLAGWHRQRFTGQVIGITGSVGKTTSREMIRTALGTVASVTASPKNYNNHVGVPLSLLEVAPNDAFAIVELGASARGEIDGLTRLAAPGIGVITCCADAHLGSFGGTDELVAAKAELLTAMSPAGVAAICGDDPRLLRAGENCPADVITFGRNPECDVHPVRVKSQQGQLHFWIDETEFNLPVLGRHHLTAALAAVAVTRVCGIPDAATATALGQFQPVPMRCEMIHVGDVTVINDTYNSSPTAMRAALELLQEIPTEGRRVVVCGDMKELGTQSQALHTRVGREIVTKSGSDVLVCCGEHAKDIATGAATAGMPADCIHTFGDPLDAGGEICRIIEPSDILLLKGSREMGMDRLLKMMLDINESSQPRMAA